MFKLTIDDVSSCKKPEQNYVFEVGNCYVLNDVLWKRVHAYWTVTEAECINNTTLLFLGQ